jgi:predicted transcriptional regulator
MASKSAPYAIDEKVTDTLPLTDEEREAVKRAEADVAAGRVHDHEAVAEWLRRRAKEIVERAVRRKPS